MESPYCSRVNLDGGQPIMCSYNCVIEKGFSEIEKRKKGFSPTYCMSEISKGNQYLLYNQYSYDVIVRKQLSHFESSDTSSV